MTGVKATEETIKLTRVGGGVYVDQMNRVRIERVADGWLLVIRGSWVTTVRTKHEAVTEARREVHGV